MSVTAKYLDSLEKLRKRVVKYDIELKLLLASFADSKQQKDIEKRTSLIQDYFRVKINVKAFDDKERAKKGLGKFDPSDMETVHKGLTQEFDMPLWAQLALGKGRLTDYNHTFIYQLNACNIRCPYCYVDDENKKASLKHKARFFSIPEIVDVFEQEREKQVLNNFRPSGGEPTLAVEQWLYALREIYDRNLEQDVYVQGDTNLTTGHFIDRLLEKAAIPPTTLGLVGCYENFGLLTSFKGTDPESYHKNAGVGKKLAKDLFDEQFYTFRKYVNAGIDVYPFLYNPNPDSLESFLERLAKEVDDERVYLKTWVISLKVYDPVRDRFSKKHKDVEEYQKSLQTNFERSKEKLEEIMERKFGIPYQMIQRPAIHPLNVK